jgi:hypothetical protein
VVGFDSIIPPGRVGTVTEEVNVSNMHGSSFTKSATITSNAKNSPTMQISMKGVIKEAVSVSPEYVQINKDKNGKFETTITLTSEKADLKIEEVTFKESPQPTDKLPAWQKDLPLPVTFSVIKDSLAQKTDHVFTVKISVGFSGSGNKSGEFIFKTDHPDAQEVKAQGFLNSGN